MSVCGCKGATVQFITWACYNMHNDIFLTGIIGYYDRLKFSEILIPPKNEILGTLLKFWARFC